jgi:hypothetical protein
LTSTTHSPRRFDSERYLFVVVDSVSRTLSQKLGITDASTVTLVHAPEPFHLPTVEARRLKRPSGTPADIVLAFFLSKYDLVDEIEKLEDLMRPHGALWIAWPKKFSGVVTDLSDQVVRGTVLSRGLVDNKVCAVNETFSALRFAARRQKTPTRA